MPDVKLSQNACDFFPRGFIFFKISAVLFSLCSVVIAIQPARADSNPCLDSGSALTQCRIPRDINPVTPRDLASLTRAYAVFSWESLLALTLPISDHDKRPLWQAFPEARDIFLPNGNVPAPFENPRFIPSACEKVRNNYRSTGFSPSMILEQTTKGDVADEFVQANRMGPLIDQNGKYIRYTISMNRDMYEYIVQNKLYSKEGQKQFFSNVGTSGIEWPRSGYWDQAVGSLFIKSAWKILDQDDDPSEFFTEDAYIYDPAGGTSDPDPEIKERCEIKTVGLVGAHIVHRTNSAPQWVWATFEHKANAPTLSDIQKGKIERHYNFFDPTACLSSDRKISCAYNQVPLRPWNPQVDAFKKRTEVIRITDIPNLISIINTKFQQSEDDTVWRNYFLVDVQFPTKLKLSPDYPTTGLAFPNPAYPDGVPTPMFLANTTMETYIQGLSEGLLDSFHGRRIHFTAGVPRVTSSCNGCHSDAVMTTGQSSGFVFALDRAQSQHAQMH